MNLEKILNFKYHSKIGKKTDYSNLDFSIQQSIIPKLSLTKDS